MTENAPCGSHTRTVICAPLGPTQGTWARPERKRQQKRDVEWVTGYPEIAGKQQWARRCIAEFSLLLFQNSHFSHGTQRIVDLNSKTIILTESLSSYSMLNNKLLPIKDWQLAHGWMGIWSTGTQKVTQDILRNQIMDDSLPHSLTIVQDLPQEHLKKCEVELSPILHNSATMTVQNCTPFLGHKDWRGST